MWIDNYGQYKLNFLSNKLITFSQIIQIILFDIIVLLLMIHDDLIVLWIKLWW